MAAIYEANNVLIGYNLLIQSVEQFETDGFKGSYFYERFFYHYKSKSTRFKFSVDIYQIGRAHV